MRYLSYKVGPFSKMLIKCTLKVASLIALSFITYSYLVAYRVYNYSVFSATSVGEGPSADGSFLTREDGEFINTLTIMFFWVSISFFV